MRTHPYRVNGERVHINVIENDDDVRAALRFIRSRNAYDLCIDTEATGLDVFSSSFRIRLLQIGDSHTAYVYPMKTMRDRVARALLSAALDKGASLHSRPFDLIAMDATGLAPLAQTAANTRCTKIMSHLIDPRGQMDGGTGHALKNLSAVYVDANAVDTQNDLKNVFKELGVSWDTIDIAHATYELYAGLDVIYGARLFAKLRALINERGYAHLAYMEHEYQNVTMRMQKRGFRIDVPYSEWLMSHLDQQRTYHLQICQQLGVENINSTAQIARYLENDGWTPTEFTKTGKAKLDKAVMDALLADASQSERTRQLISSIKSSKRAQKWNTAYATAMFNARDDNDHVHAWINSLQARTARSSISNPALQQLPSRGDDSWLIRRQVIADDGKLIVSADLDQVEFRVLAAIANISAMKRAIVDGIDLHDYTAMLVYGKGFTNGQRSLMKGVGFGRVFGGGAATLARQTGITVAQARAAIEDYDRVYHELPAYTRALQQEARANGGYIHTYNGRYMPLDADRYYAAVNYSVQSPAADWLKQSIIRISKTDGLDDCLLLPVHDEALGQADRNDAEEVARLFSECMSGELEGVSITAGGEVYGESWAHGYIKRDADGRVRAKGSGNLITDWMEVAA